MDQESLATVPIIDVDSHVAEPEDLWTSRLPAKVRDVAPHVRWDEEAGERRWFVGDAALSGVGEYCTAGWHEPFPAHPPTLEEADRACWHPSDRLKRMDEWGIRGQVLYPNVISIDSHAFFSELGPDLATQCVSAYNDFLTEFANSAPDRFIPITMLPFWDVEASVREIRRTAEQGHKGVLFGALLKNIGLENISHPMWDPVLRAAEEAELSINFHVGVSMRDRDAAVRGWDMRTKNALAERTSRISFVERTAVSHTNLMKAITQVVLRGVCQKYPRLRFVSVESGIGWLPYFLDHLDWYWTSSGAATEYPDRDLPSDYWRRQCFATFWFEQSAMPIVESFQDNLMFETDFPHETSLQANKVAPRDAVNERFKKLPEVVCRKVLCENASRLYKLAV